MIKKLLLEVTPLKKANEVLVRHISDGNVKRYCETRWNSRIERMNDLVKKLSGISGHSDMVKEDIQILHHALAMLQPLLDILNRSQSDSYNWQDFLNSVEKQATRNIDLGYKEVSAIIYWYVPWLHNNVSILLAIIDGNIDFSENAINSAVEWLKQISAKICDDLESRFLDSAMGLNGTKIKPALKIFRDKFLRKIPTSEAAVERVFSKHKMIHTELRSSLLGTTVEKMLFIRYNIKHAYPDLPFWLKKMLQMI